MNRRLATVLGSLAAIGLAWPLAVGAQDTEEAPATPGSCVACHGALTGSLGDPAQAFEADVHADAGFACASCHGGDPTVQGPGAMDPAAGYIGIPAADEIPQVCGRCHSNAGFMRQYDPSLRVDQVAEYLTSVHGQRLYEAQDAAVATCASCHGAHGIRPASDPRSPVHPLNVAGTCEGCHSDPEHMAPYGIPTDQGEKYRRSIHWETMTEGGDTSAPTCNDCHGNHGASPPGVSWVGNVCGQCHVVMAEYFAESRHSETFTRMGVPGCALCHGNHEIRPPSDDFLGLSEGAICRSCHSPEDPGGKSALAMHETIETLHTAIDSAQTVLEHAEDSGVEVGAALASLNDAQSAVIKARAAVHAFDPEIVATEAEPGSEIASVALARGLDALDELRFRRIGLTVSVLIIVGLIVGLVLKIREIEAPADGTGVRVTDEAGGIHG